MEQFNGSDIDESSLSSYEDELLYLDDMGRVVQQPYLIAENSPTTLKVKQGSSRSDAGESLCGTDRHKEGNH